MFGAIHIWHQVIDLLKESPTNRRHSQGLYGKSVCANAFCKLIGIGHGRFHKLRLANKEGSVPLDGRFVRSLKSKPPSENRQIVHEYLEELYQCVAEPMPEVSEPGVMRQMSFRRRRGKRPLLASRQGKLDKKGREHMKLLPPGTFSDYLQLLLVRYPGRKISLKLFSSAPRLK